MKISCPYFQIASDHSQQKMRSDLIFLCIQYLIFFFSLHMNIDLHYITNGHSNIAMCVFVLDVIKCFPYFLDVSGGDSQHSFTRYKWNVIEYSVKQVNKRKKCSSCTVHYTGISSVEKPEPSFWIWAEIYRFSLGHLLQMFDELYVSQH